MPNVPLEQVHDRGQARHGLQAVQLADGDVL